MISYHPASKTAPVGTTFTAGFKVADTDDVERLARGISQYAWSPCTWKGGYRKKENFVAANWFALDFDSPEMTLEEAVKSFCDMVHVIGTTRNHRKEKDGLACDRFRVLVQAVDTLSDIRTYEFNLKRLAGQYPADSSCVDGARHFFACQKIVSVSGEGYREEVVSPPPVDTAKFAAVAHYDRVQFQRFGRMPRWLSTFLERGAKDERHAKAYSAAITLLGLGVEPGAVVDMVKSAPITRPYRPREVEDLVEHALQRIQGQRGELDG